MNSIVAFAAGAAGAYLYLKVQNLENTLNAVLQGGEVVSIGHASADVSSDGIKTEARKFGFGI